MGAILIMGLKYNQKHNWRALTAHHVFLPSHPSRKGQQLVRRALCVLRDSDVFGDLIYAEGCESPLAQQTLQQAGMARFNGWIWRTLPSGYVLITINLGKLL